MRTLKLNKNEEIFYLKEKLEWPKCWWRCFW